MNRVFLATPSSHNAPFALTGVAPQSESVRRSTEGASVEINREQERHDNRTHGQRQHQLEQIPKRSPEPCAQQQQGTADAQAVKTCRGNRDKAKRCCRQVQIQADVAADGTIRVRNFCKLVAS